MTTASRTGWWSNGTTCKALQLAVTVTFQAILALNTGTTPGDITFNYPDLDAGNFRTNGGSATVGIKAAGTQGSNRILISRNSAAHANVRSGQAIFITTAPPAAAAPQVASVSVVLARAGCCRRLCAAPGPKLRILCGRALQRCLHGPRRIPGGPGLMPGRLGCEAKSRAAHAAQRSKRRRPSLHAGQGADRLLRCAACAARRR